MTHSFRRVFVDSHIHLYSLFNLRELFDNALSNFGKARGILENQNVTFALFLTRSAKDKGIHRVLEESTNKGGIPGWRIRRTDEERALIADSTGGGSILLLPGLQIVTGEGIEVLALGSTDAISDGLPAEEALSRVRENGAIPVLPWGAGKWWGRRGELVSKLIQKSAFPGLFLGDNGGRPGFWKEPNHFSLNPNLKVLPGSDPLPLASQVKVPARYGFQLDCELNMARPTESLLCALRDSESDIKPFGAREGALPFFRNQLAIQIHNRLNGMRRGIIPL